MEVTVRAVGTLTTSSVSCHIHCVPVTMARDGQTQGRRHTLPHRREHKGGMCSAALFLAMLALVGLMN